jgi:hypothetical protein
MSTKNNGTSTKQDETSQDNPNFRLVIIQSDDTVESFIKRQASEIATEEGLEGPVREAFIKRMVSLSIYKDESPSSNFSLVYRGDEALKRLKEEHLVNAKQGWAQIENYNVTQAMKLVEQAKKDPDKFVEDTGKYIRHTQANALLYPGRTTESDVYAFGNSLRQGGLPKNDIDNANEMFEAYQKMYANLGRNPEFHKYADTLAEKVKIAAEQGVVSERTRDRILKEVEDQKKTYRIWTPEETAGYEQKRTQGMKPYQELLTEMEYLRDTFAKRGNTSLGAGALPYHMAMDTIRKVDALEKILREGTPEDAAKFVRNNGLEKWKNEPGNLVDYANRLTGMDEEHFRFFRRMHVLMEATGWPPAVGAAKIMDNVIEGNRKGLSDKQITFNIGVDLISEFGAKKLTGGAGSVVKETMEKFVQVSTTEFAKEPTPEGLGKALSTGFYEAVTTVIGKDVLKGQDVFKKLTPEQREQLKDFIIEVASKAGALEAVKPYLDRIFSPPAKEQSTNTLPGPISTPATIETKNYASLLDSARRLDLQPGVTAENVALKASEVASRENVNATVIVQGSRNRDALAAVDPALDIRTSAFTQTEVRQLDVANTLAALDQRQAALQPDPEAQAQRAGRQA